MGTPNVRETFCLFWGLESAVAKSALFFNVDTGGASEKRTLLANRYCLTALKAKYSVRRGRCYF